MEQPQISTIVVPTDVTGPTVHCPHAKNGLTKMCTRCALKNAFNLTDTESYNIVAQKYTTTSKTNSSQGDDKNYHDEAFNNHHKIFENGR